MFKYKAIADPQLPPLAGHVEDEDENGNRVYRKVETEHDRLLTNLTQDNEALQTQLLTLTDTLDTVLSVILPALMG